MVVLKRTEVNRTKTNNNKAKHKQNSKKEELKEMLKMSTIHFEIGNSRQKLLGNGKKI
jgi:hypothetical protein